MNKKRQKDMRITKSVSLPLAFVESVLDEAEIANTDFSKTLVMLGKLGLSVRRDTRQSMEETDQEYLERLESARKVQ